MVLLHPISPQAILIVASLDLKVKVGAVIIDNGASSFGHGDYASNLALKFAKKLGKKPLEFAKEIQAAFVSEAVDHIEIAGPGFLNFFLKEEALGSIVATILKEGKAYGEAPKKHLSVDVEYVSANPTGDLHLGHTRGAALGDAIANLYSKAGYDVTREYYVNNCGNQVEHLGHSLSLRYHELFGEKIALGDDDYHDWLDFVQFAELREGKGEILEVLVGAFDVLHELR